MDSGFRRSDGAGISYAIALALTPKRLTAALFVDPAETTIGKRQSVGTNSTISQLPTRQTMPPIDQKLRRAIQSVRARAQLHGTHVSEYETRTRYALIDPVLLALGWDLANPVQAKLEYEIEGGRIDYALFKNGLETPVVLVEAKRLTPKGAEEFKEFSDRKQVAVSQSWGAISRRQ